MDESDWHDISKYIDTEGKEKLSNIQYLAFDGGGLKCFAYVGMMQVFDCMLFPKKAKDQLKGASGVSGGSLAALCYALDLTYLDLHDCLMLMADIHKQKYSIIDLFKKKGLLDTKILEPLVAWLLEKANKPYDLTFAQLADSNNGFNFIVSAFHEENVPFYYNNTNSPNKKILDAVCESMAMPLVFSPRCYDGNVKGFVDGWLAGICLDGFDLHKCILVYTIDINSEFGLHHQNNLKESQSCNEVCNAHNNNDDIDCDDDNYDDNFDAENYIYTENSNDEYYSNKNNTRYEKKVKSSNSSFATYLCDLYNSLSLKSTRQTLMILPDSAKNLSVKITCVDSFMTAGTTVEKRNKLVYDGAVAMIKHYISITTLLGCFALKQVSKTINKQ